ncbi:MAG: hypothetical protein HC930_08215 [Hydrococcus sp. SU_1_0]|nr:hypothetical protein [Hydrococcus sp. SU_1_0]
MLGINSYKNLCQKVGLNLDFKDLFTPAEKSKMLDMYFQRPQDFDNYSLGDLEVFNILMHHKEKFETVYDSLKISEFFSKNKLKMTIGATVENLFKSKLFKYLNINPKNKKAQTNILELCQFSSSKNLKEYVKETKIFIS